MVHFITAPLLDLAMVLFAIMVIVMLAVVALLLLLLLTSTAVVMIAAHYETFRRAHCRLPANCTVILNAAPTNEWIQLFRD